MPVCMEPFIADRLPAPSGLVNMGASCYLNSFLQALAGCTSFMRTAVENPSQTNTGAALAAFAGAYAEPGNRSLPVTVFRALAADLAARRPHVRFGAGQESASETFVHLLDMAEAPSTESPIVRLFLHRYRCTVRCQECQKVASEEADHAVLLTMFHLDTLPVPPASPAEFADAVRRQESVTEDFACPLCGHRGRALRTYCLTMVPEILFCIFNVYGARRAHYFPDRFELPAIEGGALVYGLVGQIEHAGTLAGGHYWARGLRAGGRVYRFDDDMEPTLAVFSPSPYTYAVVYHYLGHTAARAGGC
jgi:ubiquitin C-terminal hydrolase